MEAPQFSSLFWYAVGTWAVYMSWRLLRFFTQSDTHTISALENVKHHRNAVVIGHVKRSSTSIVNQLTSSTNSSIDGDTYVDVTQRLSEIRRWHGGTECDIDVYLYTPGGSLFMSQLIANLLHQWKGRTRAHIIGYAASGGTLISLACDEVVMASDSALGPIDPQVVLNIDSSAVSMHDITQCLSNDGTPRVIELDKLMAMVMQYRAVSVMRTFRKFTCHLLERSYGNKAHNIIEFFLTDREHSMPIFRHEAKKVGVNVVFANTKWSSFAFSTDSVDEDGDGDEVATTTTTTVR